MPVADFRRPANPFATRFLLPGALAYRWIDPQDGTVRSSDRDALDWLLGRIDRHRGAGIQGPHGSGKSTLLATLRPALHQRYGPLGSLTFRPGQSAADYRAALGRLTQSPADRLWLVDGWERLNQAAAWGLRSVARLRRLRLLVTLHEDTGRWPVIWRTALDPALAWRLTWEQLRDWPRHRTILMASWEARWERAGGNLREAWFELFDAFESLDRQLAAEEPGEDAPQGTVQK
jgi:hypothetical protein